MARVTLSAALAGMLISTGAAAEGFVYTVNYPLAYFAERIAGDALEVRFPGPTDEDPAFWTPDTETLLAYQKADLILLNGAGYAKWVATASLPRARAVDTSAAFRETLIVAEDIMTHAHGPEGEHAHGGLAFTTWLDLEQARLQAAAVHEAMSARWPDRSADFDHGFATLEAELQALDTALAATAAPLAGRPILASHPVYQYMARRYGLDLRSLLWEPDLVPSPEDWQALSALLADHPVEIMLWEGEPLPQTRERLKAMSITVVVFETAANRGAADFLATMRTNLDALADVLHSR